MLEWTRLDCRFVEFPVTATSPDGTPALINGVDVALLPYGRAPSAGTTWVPASYADGVVRVLVAGPDAPGGDLTLPGTVGGDLWARVVDNPETDMAFIVRFAPI